MGFLQRTLQSNDPKAEVIKKMLQALSNPLEEVSSELQTEIFELL